MESKKIRVNGDTVTLKVQTIIDIIAHFELPEETVIVELNGDIVPKDGYDRAIADGDAIELVRFVGGG